MASKQVVLLNGPSSSGKSTLADAMRRLLRERRGEEWAVVSIDDVLPMTADEPIYEDDVFAISDALCTRVREALADHPGAIVDHVITSERIFRRFLDRMYPYPVRLIHVTCPPEELSRRELARGNRCVGSAEASYTYLYPKAGYDLTVDTHARSAEQCALAILALL